MANRYVRAAGGNYNSTGTWELTPGGGESVAVPTATDDVYLVAGSGQLSTPSSGGVQYARNFDCTGYTGILTLNTGSYIGVNGNMVLSSGMTIINSSGFFRFMASGSITSNGKIIPTSVQFDGVNTFTLNDNMTVLAGTTIASNTAVILNGSTLYTAGLTMTNVACSGTTNIVLIGGTWSCSTSVAVLSNNLTFDMNAHPYGANYPIGFGSTSAPLYYKTGTMRWVSGPAYYQYPDNPSYYNLNLQGSCVIDMGKFAMQNITIAIAGTYDIQSLYHKSNFTINGSNTFTNFNVTKSLGTITVTSGTTQTMNGSVNLRACNFWGSADHATISCTSNIYAYFCSIKNINFTGGGVFTAYGSTDVSGNSGVTFTAMTKPTVYYIDPVNGVEYSTTPFGYHRVAFTGGTGTAPAVGEVMTGATSGATANVTYVELQSGTWAGGNAAGAIYFYNKSATPFQAEQINCTVSGHCHILNDLGICAYKIANNVDQSLAAGDTLRVAKSPDPVSIGSVNWDGIADRSYYTDISGYACSSATPIVVTKASHGFVTGDRVFMSAPAQTSGGYWKVTKLTDNTFSLDGSVGSGTPSQSGHKANHQTVVLSSARTKDVDNFDAAWTVANSSTITTGNTSPVAPDNRAWMKLVKASPTASTKYAYKTIASTDFSAYQQISLYLYTPEITWANNWRICFCSDTLGVTVVDEFVLPMLPSTTRWTPVVVSRTGGGNLGSAIQSIAIYSGTNTQASTGLTFDHMIATKTDDLNLLSLISKNSNAQGGDEQWYQVTYIKDTLVVIGGGAGGNSNGDRGYVGVGGSFTTYLRSTVKTPITGGNTNVQATMKSGTAGNLVSYEGGYDQVTNAQNGETFFDGTMGGGYGLYVTGSYQSINWLNFYRYSTGIYLYAPSYTTIPNARFGFNNYSLDVYSSTFGTFGNIYCLGSSGSVFGNSDASGVTITKLLCHGCYSGTTGSNWTIGTLEWMNCQADIAFADSCTVTTMKASYCYSGALTLAGNHTRIGTISELNYNNAALAFQAPYSATGGDNSIDLITAANNNVGVPIAFGDETVNNFIREVTACNNNGTHAVSCNGSTNARINKIATSGHSIASIYCPKGSLFIRNASLAETTKCSGATANYGAKVYICNLTQTAGLNYIYMDGGIIQTITTTGKLHTSPGIAWEFDVTAPARASNYPVMEKLASIAVKANKLVTVSVWVLKDHATNIGAAIFCRGSQLPGVDSDITVTKASDTSYQQLTMTFTPTQYGVITIEAKVWYVAGYNAVYFDDLSVTQDS